jgi:hypothetical protein
VSNHATEFFVILFIWDFTEAVPDLGQKIENLGTTVGVQKKLMRHADIRTTMNIYGDASSADMREAQFKIVQLALQPMNGR